MSILDETYFIIDINIENDSHNNNLNGVDNWVVISGLLVNTDGYEMARSSKMRQKYSTYCTYLMFGPFVGNNCVFILMEFSVNRCSKI
ncbi:hypothetical protein H8356DRAFT_1421002 [Neocallimastix lanati (nom. inval.)]|nr:hypothetical protein H8356DRAFT_1421002 [Neocallimastix sp. JGI-2020a]